MEEDQENKSHLPAGTEPHSFTCAGCGTDRVSSNNRIPRDWKRSGDQVLCGTCLDSRYVLRAITFPVVSPLDCDWAELRSRLRLMWQNITAASNWMLGEMYARDIKRGPDDLKMGPMPRVYLYPEARERFPFLPSQTVAALENTIARKYKAMRYDVRWLSKRSLSSFRYPTPFPLPAQAWSATFDGEVPVVSARIGETRLKLRLKGGPRFYSQRRAFEAIIDGSAIRGQLSISLSGSVVLCKIVARVPRTEGVHNPRGTLYVRTDSAKLLVASVESGDELWVYNGDHIRRWAAEHERRLRRWSEDKKFEARPVPLFAARQQAEIAKYHSRMDTACHQIAAMLAGYAFRKRFSSVEYNDSNRQFEDRFRYYTLKLLIGEKLTAKAIEFKPVRMPTDEIHVGGPTDTRVQEDR